MKALTFKIGETLYNKEIPYSKAEKKVSVFSVPTAASADGVRVEVSEPWQFSHPGTAQAATELLFCFNVAGNGEITGLQAFGNVTDVSLSDDIAAELAEAKESKRAEIAAARYDYEISGITVSDVEIKTDRESQALITGAALAATQNPDYVLTWKAVDSFVTLNAQQVVAVADAVRSHVQGAFNLEAELNEEIDAATTLAEVLAIQWNSLDVQAG